MREIRLIGKRTVALGLAFAANAVFGAAYYVDSLDGDDGAYGKIVFHVIEFVGQRSTMA